MTTDSPAYLLHQLKQRLMTGDQVTADSESASRASTRRPAQEQPNLDGRRRKGCRSNAPERRVGTSLRSPHRELLELKASPLTGLRELAEARPPGTHHRRQLARLPFLAPDLQAMILEGREPAHLNLRQLPKTELPLAWTDQRALFGVQEPALPAPLRAA